MKKEPDLNKLKADYSIIQKKYKLPEFEKLNQDFHIEKISEIETDYLVREVRKFMSDKIQNYARFIETILNPANASIFIFSIIKTLTPEEKKRLSEIYKQLTRYEIDLFELDVLFSEEKDAQFIRDFYATWQEIKKDLLKVIRVIKNNWDKETEKDSKAYFG